MKKRALKKKLMKAEKEFYLYFKDRKLCFDGTYCFEPYKNCKGCPALEC